MAYATYKINKDDAGIFSIYVESHSLKIDTCHEAEEVGVYNVSVTADTMFELQQFSNDVYHISLRTS